MSSNELRAGIIGLGQMGSPVAGRLLQQGVPLTAYDIDAAPVQRIVEKGASPAESPADVAKNSDVLITVLPNGPHVESVALGDDGILSSGNKNLMWLEMSTIDPQVTQGLVTRCDEVDIQMLDTAIGGLTVDAEEGRLLFMVGGTPENFENACTFLSHLGRCVHCGPTGAGVTMKLINNQLAGVNLVATIEALLMGRKAGLKFSDMQQVLSSTAANNAHLHRSVPDRIIKRNFEDGFSMNLMVKDAGLALDLAQRLGAPQTIGALVQQLRMRALNNGWGDKDTTIIAKVLEELAEADLAFEE
ncbi:MAG: NAD(P)-dependent oxidoreductase [Verrucomicrobia bacterium]|nr:NAD(P)-dependent oxidoreductase [Verrucomicrobiota bacterium]